MKAVILCAGYATRLMSVTNNGEIAKPLLDISAEHKTQPILYFLLDKIFRTNNFDEVIIITNNKYYNQFVSAVEKYEHLCRSNCPINVLNDGTNSSAEAKGANGDLEIVNNYIPQSYEDAVLVVAGDNYFDFGIKSLVEFHKKCTRENGNCNVVVSKRYPESEKERIANKYGILNLNRKGQIISLDEKPGIDKIKSTNVCLATYIFNRLDFDLISHYMHFVAGNQKERDSLGYFINFIIKTTPTFTYQFDDEFIDIGSPEDYYSIAGQPKNID